MSMEQVAQGLVGVLREATDRIEAERRVPADLSDQLGAAGLYHMLAPAAVGGAEASPMAFVGALEALATGDAAAAWAVMTSATTSLLLHYLEPRVARAMLEEAPHAALAGVFAPRGRAVPGDGGYTLTGRWSWASGCENAAWRMGGALVFDGEAPRTLPSGAPEIRSCFFRADDSQVHDTWQTVGMRGTGSHDVEVQALWVPSAHTSCVLLDEPRHDSALGRFPLFGLLALGVSAVGLGIARAALSEVIGLAGTKRSRGGGRRMAESELVQVTLAEAEAAVAAGRALMLEQAVQAWAVASAGDPLGDAHRGGLRMAATHAARASADAVQTAWDLAGGAAVWTANPLERHLRDVRVLTQHIMVARDTLKPVGRLLLGLPTDTSLL